MPKEVDDAYRAIKDSLRKAYPNRSEEWYTETAWKIVKKRQAEGKLPK